MEGLRRGRACIIYLMARRLTTELLFKRLPVNVRLRERVVTGFLRLPRRRYGQKFTSVTPGALSLSPMNYRHRARQVDSRGAFVFTSRHSAPFFPPSLPLSLCFWLNLSRATRRGVWKINFKVLLLLARVVTIIFFLTL